MYCLFIWKHSKTAPVWNRIVGLNNDERLRSYRHLRSIVCFFKFLWRLKKITRNRRSGRAERRHAGRTENVRNRSKLSEQFSPAYREQSLRSPCFAPHSVSTVYISRLRSGPFGSVVYRFYTDFSKSNRVRHLSRNRLLVNSHLSSVPATKLGFHVTIMYIWEYKGKINDDRTLCGYRRGQTFDKFSFF